MAGTGANPTTSTGGRFPSDLNVNRTRNFGDAQSPSSESSERGTIHATPDVVPIIQTDEPTRKYSRDNEDPYRLKGIASQTPGPAAPYDEDQARYMAPTQPAVAQQQPQQGEQSFFLPGQQHLSQQPPTHSAQPTFGNANEYDHDPSSRGDWLGPAAIGAGAGKENCANKIGRLGLA